MVLQEKITKDLQRRLQFLFTVTLFFPILFEALLKQANSPSDIDKTILSWGFIIGMLIVDYTMLEFTKKWNLKLNSTLITILLFISLGSFVAMFFMFAGLQQTGQLPGFLFYVFSTAI